MNPNLRIVISLVCAAALAMLATPELAAKLPPYLSPALAAAFAAVLQQLKPIGEKEAK